MSSSVSLPVEYLEKMDLKWKDTPIDSGKFEICREFRLLIWTSFNGQFVHPVVGEGNG